MDRLDLEPYLKHTNGTLHVTIEVGRYTNSRRVQIDGPYPEDEKEELIYKVLSTCQARKMFEAYSQDLEIKKKDPEWEEAISCFERGLKKKPDTLFGLVDSLYRFLFFESFDSGENEEFKARQKLFKWYKDYCVTKVK